MSRPLDLAALGALPGDAAPRADPRERGGGVVHLGPGAFHRAHQAVYLEDAPGGWGITAVAGRGSGTVDALAAQDGLYTVLERGAGRDRARVIGTVRGWLDARDRDGLRARVADAGTHVVTLTVTEAGYHADAGRLDAAHPEVAADLAGRAPRTAVGRLVDALDARRRGGTDAPLAVVSCDNVPANGALLRGLATDWAARTGGDRLVAWLGEHVDFCASMVDRMVPATTGADRLAVRERLGVEDAVPVVGEPFTQWVLQDAFRGARPAWEDAGATLVADVEPFERLKLRQVNAGHSVLAATGLLAGHRTVAAALADPDLAELVTTTLERELGPTLPAVAGVDVTAYRATLLERWANPRLRHRLAQIAADGAHKLPQRLLDPARELLAAGGEPAGIARAVAAWLAWLTTNEAAAERERVPAQAALADAVRRGGTPDAVAARALALPPFGPELADDERFRTLLADGLGRYAAGSIAP